MSSIPFWIESWIPIDVFKSRVRFVVNVTCWMDSRVASEIVGSSLIAPAVISVVTAGVIRIHAWVVVVPIATRVVISIVPGSSNCA